MHDYFFVVKINYIRQDCYITAETVLSQKKIIIIRMLIQSVTKFLPLVYSLSYYAFLLQKIYKIIKMFFTYCICSNYVKSHNDVHSIYLIKKLISGQFGIGSVRNCSFSLNGRCSRKMQMQYWFESWACILRYPHLSSAYDNIIV